MSGTLINTYSQLDSDILAVQLTLDASRIGYHAASLTNYDSTSESAIAAGSQIEVGGALYKFTAEETINDTEGVSDGTVYIMIVPSGTTCTAEYTNTAPTWSDSKQGFYGTGASANYRYLEFILFKSSTAYFKDKIDKFSGEEYIFFGKADGTQSNPGSGTNIYFDDVIYDKYSIYDSGTHTFSLPLKNDFFLGRSYVAWSTPGTSDQIVVGGTNLSSSSAYGHSYAISYFVGLSFAAGNAYVRFTTGTSVGTIQTSSYFLIKRITRMM